MIEHTLLLPDGDLRGLAAGLRSGRIAPPFSGLGLRRIVSEAHANRVAEELQNLTDQGFGAIQIAVTLEAVLQDRLRRMCADDAIDLVISGPETPAVASRDTIVVVRELFASAQESVLVAGYAVYGGQRIFQALADRMQERPEMSARLFLDVRRSPGDGSPAGDVVRRFGESFFRAEWPENRPRPQVFYFPLSLEQTPTARGSLHAKCVVIDEQVVFVTSANFTQAAQTRNVEIGLLVRSNSLATRIYRYFESLVQQGVFQLVH